MTPVRRIANPLGKPIMLFDGDCRFCKLWIARWRQSTGDAVEYRELQHPIVTQTFPDLARAQLEEAVHFITADGSVYRGAEAVFQSLATNPSSAWLLRLYQHSPKLAAFTETTYAFVANHRQLFSRITRLLWGQHVERSPYFLTRALFLRGLGAIYLIGFVSLWIQIVGLVGENGILPSGISNTGLHMRCAAGTALSLALIVGIAPPICLTGMWLLYLSLCKAGQEFLGFQWDNLLLETGLLAIFFAPWQFLPRREKEKPPSRAALWLLRLLLFKLMFLSGVVKLASGDPLWRNLTALSRHYETQPLPNVIAWYAHQLPLSFQKTSCAVMFAIELAAPFLLFLPRRPRIVGAISIAILQVMILLTGNYTFFNWLTLLLCIIACDDFAWTKVLPRKFLGVCAATTSPVDDRILQWKNVPIAIITIFIASISLLQIVAARGSLPFWSPPVAEAYRLVYPLRSINTYGLFAVMTPERPEIIIEGSNDGDDWKPYVFRHKPGPLNRRPTFVAPHQPRLDWQMWFAALSDVRNNPWFINFCFRLLQGSSEVLALLEQNPFPNSPPKYLRASLYDYRFTTRAERAQTGNWWKREFKRDYLPPISLDMFEQQAR